MPVYAERKPQDNAANKEKECGNPYDPTESSKGRNRIGPIRAFVLLAAGSGHSVSGLSGQRIQIWVLKQQTANER